MVTQRLIKQLSICLFINVKRANKLFYVSFSFYCSLICLQNLGFVDSGKFAGNLR